ncbi:MAG: glycosyltransferase family 4 protein [Gemmatimonadetes bacterium]|jgi:glycosyltransferase involved in cell wall biosynthesis|nr:glycosyltransferase family 4 protein [Gemmatimonadota bacterium]
MMLRIAILTSVHAPFDTRIFQKEARSLARAGHEVHLFAPHDRDERRDGVFVHGLGRPRNRIVRMVRMPLQLFAAAVRSRAQVCHFHDPELLFVGLALKLLGRRVVYDVHEDVPKDLRAKPYLPRWARPGISVVVGALQRRIARLLDRVVVAREDLLPAFQGHPGLVLVRNFPILEMFAQGGRPTDGSGPPRLVYVGGLTPIRGVVEMIAALSLLPAGLEGVRLAIYGRFSAGLQARCEALPGWSRVDYHGEVAYARVVDGLAAADVGVVCFLPVPNNVNSGPTKLFEYMAAGLAVIASDFPMWREVVDGAACGLCVDPAEPAQIASAIVQLAADRSGTAEMGRRGRTAAVERYSWEAEATRLIAMYGAMDAG